MRAVVVATLVGQSGSYLFLLLRTKYITQGENIILYEHTSLWKFVKNVGTLTYRITSLYILVYFLAKLANLKTYFDTVFLFNMLNLTDAPPQKKKKKKKIGISWVFEESL